MSVTCTTTKDPSFPLNGPTSTHVGIRMQTVKLYYNTCVVHILETVLLQSKLP